MNKLVQFSFLVPEAWLPWICAGVLVLLVPVEVVVGNWGFEQEGVVAEKAMVVLLVLVLHLPKDFSSRLGNPTGDTDVNKDQDMALK